MESQGVYKWQQCKIAKNMGFEDLRLAQNLVYENVENNNNTTS